MHKDGQFWDINLLGHILNGFSAWLSCYKLEKSITDAVLSLQGVCDNISIWFVYKYIKSQTQRNYRRVNIKTGHQIHFILKFIYTG